MLTGVPELLYSMALSPSLFHMAALVGGVTGGIAFTILPVLGTILGAILGATAGVLVVEYVGKRDWRLATRSAVGYTLGLLASSVLQMILCLLMVAIFA